MCFDLFINGSNKDGDDMINTLKKNTNFKFAGIVLTLFLVFFS